MDFLISYPFTFRRKGLFHSSMANLNSIYSCLSEFHFELVVPTMLYYVKYVSYRLFFVRSTHPSINLPKISLFEFKTFSCLQDNIFRHHFGTKIYYDILGKQTTYWSKAGFFLVCQLKS